MYRVKLKDVMPYLLMIPSIFIGTLAMISYGVSSIVWIQNIIIWIITTVLGSLIILDKAPSYSRKNNFTLSMVASVSIIIALTIPFLYAGISGVHRWVAFGPISFNIASALLPLLIVTLWRLSFRNNIYFVLALTSITLIVLLAQPDASQATAFAFAAAVALWGKITNKLLMLIFLVFSATIITLSWIFLDNLAAVPYVEQIIFLVADMGIVWLVLGVISLILLLLPFFIFNKNTLSISLGIYFLVTMLTTFFGNFPMPIMGYGTSPIIGYSIAITLLMKDQKTIKT